MASDQAEQEPEKAEEQAGNSLPAVNEPSHYQL